MNKEEMEKILKQMVFELAKEFNYKKGHEDKRRSKTKIGFSYFNIDEDLYYVQYGTTDKTNNKRNGGSIKFRYRKIRITKNTEACKDFRRKYETE